MEECCKISLEYKQNVLGVKEVTKKVYTREEYQGQKIQEEWEKRKHT